MISIYPSHVSPFDIGWQNYDSGDPNPFTPDDGSAYAEYNRGYDTHKAHDKPGHVDTRA